MNIEQTSVRPEHKAVTIIVNAREKTVTEKELSFDDVIHLAYENPPSGPDVLFTVIYHRGRGEKPEGTLVEGETVRIHDGMVFDVTPTTRS